MPSATPLTARRTPSLLKKTIVFFPEATAAFATTIATVARSGSSVECVRLTQKLFSMNVTILSVAKIDCPKRRERYVPGCYPSCGTRLQYLLRPQDHRL